MLVPFSSPVRPFPPRFSLTVGKSNISVAGSVFPSARPNLPKKRNVRVWKGTKQGEHSDHPRKENVAVFLRSLLLIGLCFHDVSFISVILFDIIFGHLRTSVVKHILLLVYLPSPSIHPRLTKPNLFWMTPMSKESRPEAKKPWSKLSMSISSVACWAL